MNALRWSPHYEPVELDQLIRDSHVKVLSKAFPIFDFDFQNLNNKQNNINALTRQVCC